MRTGKELIYGTPGNEIIGFRCNHRLEGIFLRDIVFMEYNGAYCRIKFLTPCGRIDERMICKSLKKLARLLEGFNFLRIHNKCMVNKAKIETFSSRHKTLTAYGIELMISRRKAREVFTRLLSTGIKDVNNITKNVMKAENKKF